MITQETVEKVYLTFLAPFSGVVLPFPSKRSSIVGRIAKLLFLASHKEICPEAFSTVSVLIVTAFAPLTSETPFFSRLRCARHGR